MTDESAKIINNKRNSRSGSVERLMEDNTRNFYDHLYQPKFENIPIGNLQLPYLNYESSNLDSKPEFTSKLLVNYF